MNRKKLHGAIGATAVVVLISLIVGSSNAINGLVIGPVVAFACVVLGSILTISERTREFAVGFLISSAILIFLTAGVCAVSLSTGAVSLAAGMP